MRVARHVLSAATLALISGCAGLGQVPSGKALLHGYPSQDRPIAPAKPQPLATSSPAATQQPAFARGPGTVPSGGLFATPVPPGMQYLYGSGEAEAQDLQTYIAMADFLIAKSSDKAVGHPVTSVVLAPGATLQAPVFEQCGDKPLAIVLDIDETSILNLGFEGDQVLNGGAYDLKRWDAWERSDQGKVVPVPGVLDMIDVARKSGVTVIFNSNRSSANAQATADMLKQAGFGSVEHLKTLWLEGDAGTGGAKDARRWAISARYCVVAMAGDQLGDFSDLFNADLPLSERRAAVNTRDFQILWGRGWFILPNPVYGTAIKGDFPTIFPRETRWSPPVDQGDPSPPPATGSSN
jgi:5'-nucleotidase (lipoprotein e(P4) family)